jgi:hypothetical protein
MGLAKASPDQRSSIKFVTAPNWRKSLGLRERKCETCAPHICKSSDLLIFSSHEPQIQNPRSRPIVLCHLHRCSMA